MLEPQKTQCAVSSLRTQQDCGTWVPWEIIPCLGLPCSSAGKESACKEGDPSLIPGLGSSPGGGRGNPLQSSCLENPHGQRSLVGYSPRGCKESDMTEQQSTGLYVCSYHFSILSIFRLFTLTRIQQELSTSKNHVRLLAIIWDFKTQSRPSESLLLFFSFWKCNFHKQNMRVIRDVMILFILKKLTLKNNFS